jgi:phosphoserine phosphatase
MSISGQDRLGFTAQLTDVPARYYVTVIDIGQSEIHENISLGMMIEVPAN